MIRPASGEREHVVEPDDGGYEDEGTLLADQVLSKLPVLPLVKLADPGESPDRDGLLGIDQAECVDVRLEGQPGERGHVI